MLCHKNVADRYRDIPRRRYLNSIRRPNINGKQGNLFSAHAVLILLEFLASLIGQLRVATQVLRNANSARRSRYDPTSGGTMQEIKGKEKRADSANA